MHVRGHGRYILIRRVVRSGCGLDARECAVTNHCAVPRGVQTGDLPEDGVAISGNADRLGHAEHHH
eukprot:14732278-Alexandrium_andersonii.AAC.1